MRALRVATVAALVGGVAWLVKVGLVWSGVAPAAPEVLYLVGLTALVVALAAGGYAVVADAPVWLRVVVSVAFTLLVLMVWQVLDQMIHALYTRQDWWEDEINLLLAALLALLAGGWGLRRSRGTRRSEGPPQAPGRGSRGGSHAAR